MKVKFSDLSLVFRQMSIPGSESYAVIDRQTGEVITVDEDEEIVDELDVDDDTSSLSKYEDPEKYLWVPKKDDLYSEDELINKFAADNLSPEEFNEALEIFQRKSAFRTLLAHAGKLDKWHEVSNAAEETALKEWCAENSIELEYD